MAFSHGSNDAQKTMGIITLALFAAGVIPTIDVPVWVIVVAATALSLGTAIGGWRIMRTMGHRVVELEPVHGFAAETTAATILFATAHLGMPVSTTHVISSAIMGVGSAPRARGRPLGRRPAHPARLGHHHPGRGDRGARDLVHPAHRSASARRSRRSSMTFRLLPKDVRFFDLFVADGENLQRGRARLHEMVDAVRRPRRARGRDPGAREARRRDRPGDQPELEDAFITPFDREDIHELTVRLDDVVDGIQATPRPS